MPTEDEIDEAISTLVRACNVEVRQKVTQALRVMVLSGGAVAPRDASQDFIRELKAIAIEFIDGQDLCDFHNEWSKAVRQERRNG